MTRQRAERPADPGLESLLQIEQRLRARVDAAQAQSRAQLDAALAEVRALREREAALFEEAAGAREQVDRQWQREQESRLLAEHAAALQRLADVSSERIDALARSALAHAIEPLRAVAR